jgi:periplasmic divalent cation tolerance protein
LRESGGEDIEVSAEAYLVLTTCADPAEAAALADRLVGARLAACVNRVDSIASTYRWQDRVEHAQEALLIIKTSEEQLEAVETEIRSRSSYELPEIIAVRLAGGSEAYLDWIRASVRSEQA